MLKMMGFEWDDEKAESNHRKDQVRFEEAQTVFLDRHAVDFFDAEHGEDEDRFIRIGLSGRLNVLLVVYCESDGTKIRIISARKATSNERKLYEKGI